MLKLLVLDPKLGDLAMNKLNLVIIYWRTEPTYVAKYGDNLWLGVKG